MLFKKFVSVLIAMAMVASVCLVSVSASDLTAENISSGAGAVKGNSNGGAWARVHTGSNDASRTTATMTVNSDQTVTNPTCVINAYNGVSVSGAKFVHSTFIFNSTGSFQIRIRNGSSNTQWMNFSNSGTVGGNGSTAVGSGEWGVSEIGGDRIDNTVDIIVNTITGAGYCFVNGQFISYTKNLQKDGTWKGYSVYTDGTWTEGDNFQWKYNVDKNIGWTKYVDTDDHKVTLEEVLIDKGLISGDPEESLLFMSDDVADYTAAANEATLTYPTKDSIKIDGDYYNESAGYAKNFMHMFSGNGYLAETELGGNLICVSYIQQIANASRLEVRLCAGGQNQNSNRLTFVPEDGKIRVSSFSNKARTLDKEWGDAVNTAIIIDKSAYKAYTFIDGALLGDAFDFSKAGDFTDLKMYLNGTENDSVASVTLSGWMLLQYDSKTDSNGLVAEIVGMPVYFSQAGNSLEVVDDAFAMSVTAKATGGAVDDGAKLYVGVYAEDGKLIGFDTWDYADGVTNDELVFEYTGAEKTVKVFCFSPELDVLAMAKTYSIADYVTNNEE